MRRNLFLSLRFVISIAAFSLSHLHAAGLDQSEDSDTDFYYSDNEPWGNTDRSSEPEGSPLLQAYTENNRILHSLGKWAWALYEYFDKAAFYEHEKKLNDAQVDTFRNEHYWGQAFFDTLLLTNPNLITQLKKHNADLPADFRYWPSAIKTPGNFYRRLDALGYNSFYEDSLDGDKEDKDPYGVMSHVGL